MPQITLSREVYRDKVYACWLGKTIGGTLAAAAGASARKRRYEDQL